jgi:hypothetical protein
VRAKEVRGEFLQSADVTIDDVIRAKLVPMLEQNNNRSLAVEDYPAIAAYDRNYYAQLWKVAPSQDQHMAKGVIYEDDAGLRGLVVVRLTTTRSQFSSGAFYFFTMLARPSASVADRKPEYVQALANTRPNPQQIAAYNQREQQKASASQSSFNARQRQKQQQFDNWMATQRQNSDSALDSSMDSWRRRQDMIDSGHQRQVDAIGGNTQVYNPGTGETWQVQDGYDRYYMNTWGEYIPTDDAFYDPNMDPAMNNQQWMAMMPGYYGQ